MLRNIGGFTFNVYVLDLTWSKQVRAAAYKNLICSARGLRLSYIWWNRLLYSSFSVCLEHKCMSDSWTNFGFCWDVFELRDVNTRHATALRLCCTWLISCVRSLCVSATNPQGMKMCTRPWQLRISEMEQIVDVFISHEWKYLHRQTRSQACAHCDVTENISHLFYSVRAVKWALKSSSPFNNFTRVCVVIKVSNSCVQCR